MDNLGVTYFIIISGLIGILLGVIIMDGVKDKRIENFTLIENQSNEWYWLEGQEYREAELREFYTLKGILLNNECTDGGFIENLDGEEFLIVCYQAKKVIKVEPRGMD